MSTTTNVILYGVCADEVANPLNKWLEDHADDMSDIDKPQLHKVDQHGNNRKVMNCVWIGVFNYFPMQEFIEYYNTLQCDCDTWLMLDSENDESVRMVYRRNDQYYNGSKHICLSDIVEGKA